MAQSIIIIAWFIPLKFQPITSIQNDEPFHAVTVTIIAFPSFPWVSFLSTFG